MVFLERLGDHQARLEPHLIDDWLHHLDGTLLSMFTETDLQPWRGIGVPFERALLSKGFKPDGMTTAQRARYRAIVHRLARAVEGA